MTKLVLALSLSSPRDEWVSDPERERETEENERRGIARESSDILQKLRIPSGRKIYLATHIQRRRSISTHTQVDMCELIIYLCRQYQFLKSVSAES